MIVRQSSGVVCCLCGHEATMLTNGAWFCPDHYACGVDYLSRLIAAVRALDDTPPPAPEAPEAPEPDVVPDVAATKTPRVVRPPARPPRPDRTILSSMSDRDLREEVARALDRGWQARRVGSGHVHLHHPVTGARASTSTTRGSGGRGLLNLRAALARGERPTPKAEDP